MKDGTSQIRFLSYVRDVLSRKKNKHRERERDISYPAIFVWCFWVVNFFLDHLITVGNVIIQKRQKLWSQIILLKHIGIFFCYK